jgi:hypothetical protein
LLGLLSGSSRDRNGSVFFGRAAPITIDSGWDSVLLSLVEFLQVVFHCVR